jgi:hypothetical protein
VWFNMLNFNPLIEMERNRAKMKCRYHNPKVGGSNPSPATPKTIVIT